MSSDIEFYGFAAVKAIFSAIPNIGGSIASILGDIQSKRNEARLKDFLEQFAKDMESRKGNIQIDYVSSPDFIDIFMNITEDAMKQRQEKKRTLLKNLLVNSITIPDTTYDVTEELQRLIDLLSPQHIEVLGIFYEDRNNPMKEANTDTVRIMDAIISHNIAPIFAPNEHITFSVYSMPPKEKGGIFIFDEDGKKNTNSDPFIKRANVETYLEYIRDLENAGLVGSYLNNVYARESGAVYESDDIPYITAKGRALIKYVKLR